MAEAELTTIARPYARAAFSFAVDSDGLAEWSKMLALLSAALDQAVIRAKLDDPVLTKEESASFLCSLLDAELNDNSRNFVGVLAEYDRIALLPNIAELYELLKADHEKTINVEVTSAYEVTDDEAAKLSSVLRDRLQREINLTTSVDASLIGGVIVRAEDTVTDNSVRGKLRKLSQALS
jgi:F-type H+-transporting ATPase subunit delta